MDEHPTTTQSATDGTEAIFDHRLVSARYFFRQPDHFSDPFRIDVPGARLACYFHRPFPEGRTVIHWHGNGEVIGDYLEDFLPEMESLGLNCLFAEYRGYGMSRGSPSLVRMLYDVEAIIRAAAIPPERLILFGRSVGSIYALEGAYRFPQVAGLVLESGIADPLERILLRVQPDEVGSTMRDFEEEAARFLDHRKKMAAYPGPSLIMHTLDDGLVDVSHAYRLHDWAGGSSTLRIFEDGDHNSILLFNRTAYFGALREFLVGHAR